MPDSQAGAGRIAAVGAITAAAIQSGKLDASDRAAVKEYFGLMYYGEPKSPWLLEWLDTEIKPQLYQNVLQTPQRITAGR